MYFYIFKLSINTNHCLFFKKMTWEGIQENMSEAIWILLFKKELTDLPASQPHGSTLLKEWHLATKENYSGSLHEMSVWILPLWGKWEYLPFRIHVRSWRPHHSKVREQILPGFPLWPDLHHYLKMPNKKIGLMVLDSRVQDQAVHSFRTVSRLGIVAEVLWQNQQLTHEPVSKRNESWFSILLKAQFHILGTSHWPCFLCSPSDDIST